MDINANYSEEDNPLSLKADFILSLCELVVGDPSPRHFSVFSLLHFFIIEIPPQKWAQNHPVKNFNLSYSL